MAQSKRTLSFYPGLDFTCESGDSVSASYQREESRKRAKNIYDITRALIVGALVSLVSYLTIYFQSHIWQMLIEAGFLLISLFCAFQAVQALRRINLDRAGFWLILGVVISYGGAELIWSGVSMELALSSGFLVILVGSLTIPKRWKTWSLLLLLLALYFGLLSVYQPFPRYPIQDTYVNNLILIVTGMVIVGVMWQVVKLGGKVDSLVETVDDLHRLDVVRRRQIEELSVLHAIAVTGTNADDEQTLLEEATLCIGETLYPDNFGIMLLDLETQTLRMAPSYRLNGTNGVDSLPLGRGVTGIVAAEGHPRRIADVTQDPAYLPFNAETRSELCVPIRVREEVIGVINVESSAPDAFTKEDEQFLTTLAGQLAIALERVRLFSETTESLAREQRLNEISRTISAELDLQIILPAIVRLTAESIGAEAGILTLIDEEDPNLLTNPYIFNLPEGVGDVDLGRGDGLAWTIIEKGEPLMLSDYGSHSRALKELVGAGIQATVAAPVMVGGEIIGALGLFGLTPGVHFSERDLALVESVGRQAGITIQNARLFSRVQAHAAELAKAIARLEEMDQVKSELIQNISHELRTPLTIIRGYVDLLETEIADSMDPIHRQAVEIIGRRVQMLSQMVADLTGVIQAETKKLREEPVDLTALVQEAVLDFQINTGAAQLALSSEIDPMDAWVFGDPVYLRRVLDNLLGNALKFTPAGGSITVRLEKDGDAGYLLSVSDTGIGIPADKLERVFERFYQVDGSSTRRYGGTGLGLALVKEIVETHGGIVGVESAEGQGTSFRVSLPRLTEAMTTFD